MLTWLGIIFVDIFHRAIQHDIEELFLKQVIRYNLIWAVYEKRKLCQTRLYKYNMFK